ncbi:hypothetical protein VKT23_016991 [Stygiomarasmius scandens]|uniref:Uncharacterized protein n=1 Tax=Marasmiellus scandens TaxID=2682957 RepID=A0ABR1ITH0_9AGAR
MHHLVGRRQEAGTGTPSFVVFDVLQALALVLLLVTYFAALFSKSITRMKTWFCLMLSSIIYCISFLLLVGHQDGPDPPFPLCIFQAGLIYAAPATVAASGLGFVIELYMRLSSGLTMTELSHRKITVLMFLSPLAHLLVFWVGIFGGLSNQSAVERIPSGMYCHINASVPTMFTGVTTVTFLVLMVLLEAYTGYYLWRRRRGLVSLRSRGSDGSFPFKLFIRMAVFTLVGGMGMIMVDILMNTKSSASSADITLDLLAIIPLSIAILFGSQTEYLKVYMFWKKNLPQNEPVSKNASHV